MSRQLSSTPTICCETASWKAMNGLSARAGFRFVRTCSAATLTNPINGLLSAKALYCSRSGWNCFISLAGARLFCRMNGRRKLR